MNINIFKANDIRGIVDTQLTPDVVTNVGKALGSLTLESGCQSLIVGRDGRLSSDSISQQLCEGILSTGCDVIDIGLVTTPMVYFANFELGTGSGVMITGSHNPKEYNGFKMVVAEKTLTADQIQSLRTKILENDFKHGQGNYQKQEVSEHYVNAVAKTIQLTRPVKVAVDCGNGAAGVVAVDLLKKIGCDVEALYCDVDGNFPNHHPDPSRPENLKDLIHLVAEKQCELGLAFDGDGDRLGVVTKDGQTIYPDRQMMLFSEAVLAENPGANVIFDVKSTRLLAPWIKVHGGNPIMCKTGHSFVKAKIKETGALLAGEMSGHLFFKDKWNGTDDATYAAARLIEILSHYNNPSEKLNSLPNTVSTPEINTKVPDGQQYSIMQQLQKAASFKGASEVITIDGLRVEYPDGFGLVRASNTTPVLVLRFEADDKIGLERIMNEFRALLKDYVAEVNF